MDNEKETIDINELLSFVEKECGDLELYSNSLSDFDMVWNDYIKASLINHPEKIKKTNLNEFDNTILNSLVSKIFELSKKADDICFKFEASEIDFENIKEDKFYPKDKSEDEILDALILRRNNTIYNLAVLEGGFISNFIKFIFKYIFLSIVAISILFFVNKDIQNNIKTNIFKIALEEKILKKEKKSHYTFFINTNPTNCKIRIMNIKPKFTQGIVLKPGKYQVEVSKKGYKTYKQWIELKDDKTLNVTLQK